MKISFETNNDRETFALAERLAAYLQPDTNLLLDGDLAAGKTVFAKGLGKGLNIREHIKSPSYTLLCMYQGRLPFYHFDTYNLNGPDDFYDLGFEEYIDCGGVVLIEWASVIRSDFSYGHIHIDIEKTGEESRKLIITAEDEHHMKILKEWRQNENTGL